MLYKQFVKENEKIEKQSWWIGVEPNILKKKVERVSLLKYRYEETKLVCPEAENVGTYF